MFEHLNLTLPDIKEMRKLFGAISAIPSGDLLCVLLNNSKYSWNIIKENVKRSRVCYGKMLSGFTNWVTDILYQSSYREFSDILSRVREGKHTTDIEKIEAFEDTDTSTWPRKVLIYIAPITQLYRKIQRY